MSTTEKRFLATPAEAEAFSLANAGVFTRPEFLGGLGQRLWVAEEWAHYQRVEDVVRQDGRAYTEVGDGAAGYRADGHDTVEDFRAHIRLMAECRAVEVNGDAWRPAEEMPRWASRGVLEVTSLTGGPGQ